VTTPEKLLKPATRCRRPNKGQTSIVQTHTYRKTDRDTHRQTDRTVKHGDLSQALLVSSTYRKIDRLYAMSNDYRSG
jgi:hypothetical protein